MLITLYKIGELHFRLLGTNGFHVKAKSERFTAATSRCRQNLKYENSKSSFSRLRQNIGPKSVQHVQHDYFSSFNQSNHWFVALSWTLPSSDVKLPIIFFRVTCMKHVWHPKMQFDSVNLAGLKNVYSWQKTDHTRSFVKAAFMQQMS